MVLTHDGPTSKTQNYLVVNEQWDPVGPAHSVRFNHTHIELKVDVNIPNIPVQMAVDKVRLYPNPAHNPIHNQKVQIFEDGSKRLLGEALTNEEAKRTNSTLSAHSVTAVSFKSNSAGTRQTRQIHG